MAGLSLQSLQLLDILPPSLTWDATIQALAGAVDPLHQDATGTIPVEVIYAALDKLPDAILDAVAWGFHVEGYDLLSTRAERLYVVKAFWDYHRYKGTVHGLEMYLRTFAGLLAADEKLLRRKPHRRRAGGLVGQHARAARLSLPPCRQTAGGVHRGCPGCHVPQRLRRHPAHR